MAGEWLLVSSKTHSERCCGQLLTWQANTTLLPHPPSSHSSGAWTLAATPQWPLWPASRCWTRGVTVNRAANDFFFLFFLAGTRTFLELPNHSVRAGLFAAFPKTRRLFVRDMKICLGQTYEASLYEANCTHFGDMVWLHCLKGPSPNLGAILSLRSQGHLG